jgi:RimJ/RimL family protein N-acetyltransferase
MCLLLLVESGSYECDHQLVMAAGLPELRGQGCVLRSWTMADLPTVMEAGRDPLIPLITTVPTDGSEHSAREFVERQWSRRTSGRGYSFAVAVGGIEEQAVGQIGLWPMRSDPARASIGYWVAASRRGAGIAGRALNVLAGWAFSELAVARLELFVEPWNVSSIKVAEGAGFTREGLLRRADLVGDERRDVFAYGLLRDDWECVAG